MAFIKCSGGSKVPTETELWHNPNIDTGNYMAFSAQVVTLSQDMDNFNYIKCNYRFNRETDKTINIYWSIDDIKNTSNTKGSMALGMGMLDNGSASRGYARVAVYSSNTEISFKSGFSSSGGDNNCCIPLYLYGVKY